LPARLRLEFRDQNLQLRIPAIADSAVDSGKTRFRPRKSQPRRRKPDWNQHLGPILATLADSGNRVHFAVFGSGPAAEFNAMSRAC
jgi:hypothetical protein